MIKKLKYLKIKFIYFHLILKNKKFILSRLFFCLNYFLTNQVFRKIYYFVKYYYNQFFLMNFIFNLAIKLV